MLINLKYSIKNIQLAVSFQVNSTSPLKKTDGEIVHDYLEL